MDSKKIKQGVMDDVFNPKLFDEDYYERGYRGGFSLTYTWEKIAVHARHKIKFIQENFPPVETILFGACAKGFEIKAALEQGYITYGIDISEYAIRQADELARDYVEVGDLRDMKFADDSFDMVACFDVIQTIDPRTRYKAYEEIQRVAKSYVLLRTSFLDGDTTEPIRDGTWDGTMVFRETELSLLTAMAQAEKFKPFYMQREDTYYEKLNRTIVKAWICFERI